MPARVLAQSSSSSNTPSPSESTEGSMQSGCYQHQRRWCHLDLHWSSASETPSPSPSRWLALHPLASLSSLEGVLGHWSSASAYLHRLYPTGIVNSHWRQYFYRSICTSIILIRYAVRVYIEDEIRATGPIIESRGPAHLGIDRANQ